MLEALAAALAVIPDAIGLGLRAMGFEAEAFRRVTADPRARDLALVTVYLAGLSQAVGHGVILFLNRVPPARFALSLALMAAIYVVGALTTSVAAVLIVDAAFGRSLAFLPTIAVVALAHAPRLLACLILAPYLGEAIDRVLQVWVLALVLFGVHVGLGLPLEGAVFLALVGWVAARLLALVLGRPLGALTAAVRHAAAGGPLTLNAGNLVDALKAQAREEWPQRDREP